MEDQSIICFKHCSQLKIFCFSLPFLCPICNEQVYYKQISGSLIRVPSPFLSCEHSPCSVLLKPTNGTFLRDFSATDDLHIGLTSSTGKVYEYDEDGATREKSHLWKQCIRVFCLYDYRRTEESQDLWDHGLETLLKDEKWKKERYCKNEYNCYNFVLSFLKSMKLSELENAVEKRELFCEKFMLKKTTFAARYITIYRRLLKERVAVQ